VVKGTGNPGKAEADSGRAPGLVVYAGRAVDGAGGPRRPPACAGSHLEGLLTVLDFNQLRHKLRRPGFGQPRLEIVDSRNLVVVWAEPLLGDVHVKPFPTIRHLVQNALRMRPDRIIIGEVREGEALDILQAMNPGHDGSLTTAHAKSLMKGSQTRPH
jgi:hypothetical protein